MAGMMALHYLSPACLFLKKYEERQAWKDKMIEPNSELQAWELPCQDLNSEWRCPRSLTSMLRCKMERFWHEQSLPRLWHLVRATLFETQQRNHVTLWAAGTLKGRLALKGVPPTPTLSAQAGTGAAHSPTSTCVQALAPTVRVGCHIAPGEPGRDSRHPIARMGRWNK